MAFLQVQFFARTLNVESTVNVILPEAEQGIGVSAAGEAALHAQSYYDGNCRTIMENRQFTTDALRALGFTVLPSMANFIFARHPDITGEALYRKLKEKGILVRHFSRPEITDFVRITIGSRDQMQSLADAVRQIL
jgi:histidinol-phosphate aminotransferase